MLNFQTGSLKKNEYRIPLGLLTDLGLCNFPIQTDTKITITLERDLNKLFESNKKVTAMPANPDGVIRFHDRPYISYQELTLTAVYETYLKTILRSESALRMGVLPAPFQQLFEINTGAQSYMVTFTGAERQFDCLEILLTYDKCYQHVTIYDSYDIELAAKLIQSVRFENTSKTYSLTGKLEYDFKNSDDENLLHKMFVAYNCNGCTSAPITQYKNNEIFQDITKQDQYRDNTKDDRLYIDMRRSRGNSDELEKLTRDDSSLNLIVMLKAAATKKLRMRIVGYSQGEYWYAFTKKGYVMSYKNYNISKSEEF